MCEGSILAGFDGVWAYDNPRNGETDGHAYNYHDTVLTIQWFSEIFRSFARPFFGDVGSQNDLIKELYFRMYMENEEQGVEPPFDEFGLSPVLELMETMEYTTCYLWQLNVGETGQMPGETISRDIKSLDGVVAERTINAPLDACSFKNKYGKVMLYPALSISANGGMDADEIEHIKESNEHSGLHADLDSYELRHANSAKTDAFSCYMAVTGNDEWGTGASFITKVFDCNVAQKAHGGAVAHEGLFEMGSPASGWACDLANRFPVDYSGESAEIGDFPRSEVYAECSSAFPTM